MLSHVSSTETPGTLKKLPTIIDEAQNELDPFWDNEPPLTHFIGAVEALGHVFSISEISLRMKGC